MRCVSKRRNISFEGCAFKNFSYQTEDPERMARLKRSKMYGKDFIEIDQGEDIKAILSKPANQLNLDELKAIIARREGAKEVNFEKVEGTITLNADTITLDNDSKTNSGIFESWEYKELKEEAKERGMKWKGFPKRVDLIEYLNGNRT